MIWLKFVTSIGVAERFPEPPQTKEDASAFIRGGPIGGIKFKRMLKPQDRIL